MDRFISIRIILPVCLASSIFVSEQALAQTTVVNQLQQTFGDPAEFVTRFEATVKDRSDQIVGLLVAASGFVYAIRVFTH